MSLYVELTKEQRQQQLKDISQQLTDFETQGQQRIRQFVEDKAKVKNEISRLQKGAPPKDPIERAYFMANRTQMLEHLQNELRRIEAEHKSFLSQQKTTLKTLKQRQTALELELAS